MTEMKPLTYIDEEGNVLKGFSQIDLDKLNVNIERNNELLKRQTIIYGVFFLFVAIFTIWIAWQAKKYHIITHYINAIR